MKKKFIVKGMSCASCVAHVEKAVKKLNDANDINVSLLNNSLELETTTLTDEEIMKAVKKAGFKISREDNSYLNEINNFCYFTYTITIYSTGTYDEFAFT